MSMTDVLPIPAAPAPARPRSSRSTYAWEAAKAAFAVVTFAALLLPVAYPSKAGTQAKLAQITPIEAPQPVVKAQPQAASQAPKAGTVTQVKGGAVQVPAKKPAPKNT